MSDIFSVPVKDITGKETSLAPHKGKVLLIVNTASRCGFTGQYDGLEKLQQAYAARGFTVLGFPCNQFLNQEPGDAAEIQSFCQMNFNTSFPLYAKLDVKGRSQHPLYALLTDQARGFLGTKAVKWNFTKFLIDQNGRVIKRFAPKTEPEKIAPYIEQLLGNN